MSRTDKVLLGLFCLVPVGVLSTGILHQGHKYSWIIAAVAILASQVENRWIRYFFYWACLWQVTLCLMFMTRSIPPVQAADSFSFMFFCSAFLVCYLVAARSYGYKAIFYNVICGATLFQCSIALTQVLGWDPVLETLRVLYSIGIVEDKIADVYLFGYQYKSMVGTLANNNFLACFLVITMPFFWRPKWKVFMPLLVFLVLALLTATATLAGGIAALWYFWPQLRKSKIAWGLVILGIAYLLCTKYSLTIGLIDTLKGGQYDRFQWAQMIWLQMITSWDHFMFGFGQGRPWGFGFPIHNEYLEVWHHFGLVGLFFTAMFLRSIICNPKPNRKLIASVIAASLTCIGTYPMHLAPHTFLVAIVLGIIEREKIDGDRQLCNHGPVRRDHPVKPSRKNSSKT